MDMDNIECGGFIFTSNFDSGNLAHVELIPPKVDSGTFMDLFTIYINIDINYVLLK